MTTISPQQLYEKLGQEDIFLCDVRELQEYQDGHIAGSTHLPLSQLSQQLILLPKEKTIITICAHGIRSEKARQFLVQQGYMALTLVGGMEAWDEVC
jgi:rhodanese-related sulfurtransferase